jgi:putative phage-type endonuclease
MTGTYLRFDIKQGSPEWHALRKTKVTSTDAAAIMGSSKWKTQLDIYNEKKDINVKPLYISDRMQRGIDLEPIARSLFTVKTGIIMQPAVVVHENGWMMASLDGISNCGRYTLEIKCPGFEDHHTALQGKIPKHYYAQNQHIISCVKPEKHFYFSFDGFDGIILEVERDDAYIAEMEEAEKRFYELLQTNTPPEPSENDYTPRDDELWKLHAIRLLSIDQQIKQLMQEREIEKNALISLCGESNCRGAGISLSKVKRAGNVDYALIPELKNVDLEPYRKPATISWRILCL